MAFARNKTSVGLECKDSIRQALDHLESSGTITSAILEQLIRRCSAAKALDQGTRLHKLLETRRIARPRFLNNLLLDMYGKCRSLHNVKRMFDSMPNKNVVTWTLLMRAYVENGEGMEAVRLFHRMCAEGEPPDRVAFLKAIDSCGAVRALACGKAIHGLFAGTEFESDVMVTNSLISMYGKCHELHRARSVFDGMRDKDIVSWNAIIAAYAQNGHNKQAVEVFDDMERRGVVPDRVTFISTLDACSSLREEEGLARGKQIHSRINELGLEVEGSLATTLVNMYGRCGEFAEAKSVFDKTSGRDMVSWNTMMNIYVQFGLAKEALRLFQTMDLSGVTPTGISFVAALDACSSMEALKQGRHVHSAAALSGFDSELVTANAIVNMYGKCGSLEEALDVFHRIPAKNEITWSTMVSAYSRHGLAEKALLFFRLMQHEGMKVDTITYITVLDAYTSLNAVQQAKALHARIVDAGLGTCIALGNTLINMYGKCSYPEHAKEVFDGMPQKDTVSWNAMLAAYAQNGRCNEALKLYEVMSFKPDKITFMSVLDACASAAAANRGTKVHEDVNSIEDARKDPGVQNALVHMYGRCGNLEEARRIFDSMEKRNVISWTSMMTSYAQNGLVKNALRLFEQMLLEGIRPNDITFLTVLYCCSHSGNLKDAVKHFLSMKQDHGVSPRAAHFGCLIDLLARSGRLAEAEELITTMPVEADVVLWTSFLCACVTAKDEERGARAAEQVFKLQPTCSAAYTMLSNLYSALKKWDEAAKVRRRMQAACGKKQTGASWIEIGNEVHEFIAGDSIHPARHRILEHLEKLGTVMKARGYQPDRNMVLHSMEDNEKDDLLYYHSEKLAITFGIISTPPKTPLSVVKNLRICSDCHSAIKFMSVVEERRITVRDSSRFHHFDQGVCSCGDYW